MRLTVFTAWFGTADRLKPPKVLNPQVQYLCMTDRPDQVPGWRMHRVQTTDRPRWLARWAKTNLLWIGPHDVSIWMDASFALLVDPIVLVTAAAQTQAPIVAFRHPDRRRISDEAEAVLKWNMAPAVAVRHQIAAYHAAGFDGPSTAQCTLTSTGLLVRWNSPDVELFNEAWWREIQRYTLRDQLSVDYCAWRARLPIGYLPGSYRDNPFVRYDHQAHRTGRVA